MVEALQDRGQVAGGCEGVESTFWAVSNARAREDSIVATVIAFSYEGRKRCALNIAFAVLDTKLPPP